MAIALISAALLVEVAHLPSWKVEAKAATRKVHVACPRKAPN